MGGLTRFQAVVIHRPTMKKYKFSIKGEIKAKDVKDALSKIRSLTEPIETDPNGEKIKGIMSIETHDETIGDLVWNKNKEKRYWKSSVEITLIK